MFGRPERGTGRDIDAANFALLGGPFTQSLAEVRTNGFFGLLCAQAGDAGQHVERTIGRGFRPPGPGRLKLGQGCCEPGTRARSFKRESVYFPGNEPGKLCL